MMFIIKTILQKKVKTSNISSNGCSGTDSSWGLSDHTVWLGTQNTHGGNNSMDICSCLGVIDLFAYKSGAVGCVENAGDWIYMRDVIIKIE